MKFRSLGQSNLNQAGLETGYRQAEDFGRVKAGPDCLFFPAFSGVEYLVYSEVRGGWLRQEEVVARLCCGRANFDQFYLMAEGTDGRVHKGRVTDLAAGRRLLECLGQHAPQLCLGMGGQGRAGAPAADS